MGAAASPDLLNLGPEGALHALSVEAPGQGAEDRQPSPAVSSSTFRGRRLQVAFPTPLRAGARPGETSALVNL